MNETSADNKEDPMSFRLGVDVGGTFTDLLLINEETGDTYTAKILSTPEDSSIGVLRGIERICNESGVDPATIDYAAAGVPSPVVEVAVDFEADARPAGAGWAVGADEE